MSERKGEVLDRIGRRPSISFVTFRPYDRTPLVKILKCDGV